MIDNISKTQAISTTGLVFAVVLSVLVLISSGCSITGTAKHPEPGIIAVRNNSGTHLSVVSLREKRNTPEESARMGSVSPVPNGATQVFERPSPPPALSKQVIISWQDNAHRHYEREISLERVLRDSAVTIKSTLVFEIKPYGRIDVYIE